MRKKIISYLLLVVLLLSNVQCVSAETMEDFISLSMKTEEVGRIYSDWQEERKFDLLITANDEAVFKGTIKYNITNDIGAVLYQSKETDYTLNGKDELFTLSEKVPENVKKNGVYYLNMTVTSKGNGNYLKVEEKTFEKTFYFSIAPEWKEGQEKANIGINDCAKNYYNSYCSQLFSLESKLGMDSLRIGNEWQFVERNGKWGFTEGFGEQLPTLYDYGFTDSIFMLGLNKYDYSQTSAVMIPNDDNNINAFLEYVKYIVNHTPQVKYYELWNEAEHGKWLDATGPEDYAYLQKCVYKTIKEIRPDALVGGMGSFATSYGEQSQSYWRRMLDAGIGECTDFVVLHTYTYPKAPDDLGNAGADVISNGGKWIKNLFAEYGYKDIEVLLDECGVPTKESWRQGMGRVPEVYSTEDEQAKWLPRIPALAMSDGGYDKIWYYTYADDSSEPFGIVRRSDEPTRDMEFDNPMTAKKGYVTVCAWTRLMGNCEYVDGYTSYNEELKLRRFKKKSNGEQTIIGWYNGGNDTKCFDLGCKKIELYDQCANFLGSVESNNGIYDLTFYDEPIYIKGNFTKLELSESQPKVNIINKNISVAVNDEMKLDFEANSAETFNIEVEGKEYVKEIQNNRIVNGKGSVVLSVGNVLKDFPLIIKIKDSKNKVISLSQIFVSINKDILSVENVITESFSENDSYHWRSLVTIKNNTAGKVLSGNIRLSAPDDAAKQSNVAKFINLKPQQEMTLRVNLPPMPLKESRTFEWTITLSDGQKIKYSKAIDLTCAKFTEEPPKIDGNLDDNEWKGDWIREQNEEKVNILQSGAVWSGPNDLSMRCNMMYDNEKFYMAVRVTDDTYFNTGNEPSNIWQLDSIQVGMEDVIGKVNSNFLEFGMCSLSNNPCLYRWSSAYGGAMEYTEGYELAIKRNGRYTDYELAIEWKTLFHSGFDINSVNELGFSMLVNDNDGNGRKAFIEYNSGIGIAKNALLFGRMKLIK